MVDSSDDLSDALKAQRWVESLDDRWVEHSDVLMVCWKVDSSGVEMDWTTAETTVVLLVTVLEYV